METVECVVYHVRPSRSQQGTDAVYLTVNDETGNDDRVFPIHAPTGTYHVSDKIWVTIDGAHATPV